MILWAELLINDLRTLARGGPLSVYGKVLRPSLVAWQHVDARGGKSNHGVFLGGVAGPDWELPSLRLIPSDYGNGNNNGALLPRESF